MSLERTAEVCRVLGEPNRLRFVALLANHGTLCGCELEAITGLPQYTVSRGLGALHRVGLVERERQGARREYRLARNLSARIRAHLDAVVACAADDPQLRADQAAVAAALTQLTTPTPRP